MRQPGEGNDFSGSVKRAETASRPKSMGRCRVSPTLALALLLSGSLALMRVRRTGDGPFAQLPAFLPDVNSAPARHLLLLPGVGPVRAKAIVIDRERTGPFRSLEELERVRGVGPRTVARLRRVATAGARGPP